MQSCRRCEGEVSSPQKLLTAHTEDNPIRPLPSLPPQSVSASSPRALHHNCGERHLIERMQKLSLTRPSRRLRCNRHDHHAIHQSIRGSMRVTIWISWSVWWCLPPALMLPQVVPKPWRPANRCPAWRRRRASRSVSPPSPTTASTDSVDTSGLPIFGFANTGSSSFEWKLKTVR